LHGACVVKAEALKGKRVERSMVRMKRLFRVVSLVFVPWVCFAVEKPVVRTPRPGPKAVNAIRTAELIVVDGHLEEEAWQKEAVSGFIQNDPRDGEPATERTEVWVAYDEHALYVAAFCRDSEPSQIMGRLGRRDAAVDSDWFMFAVDPYHDKRTGYLFAVNPSGSIRDMALFNDVSEDTSWDGIWEWKTEINGQGWTVEMKIPFHQLRFPKREEYVWGVNFRRIIKRKNETASFSWVPKDEAAFVSRFAELRGIRGIRAGRHLEIFPYAVSQARFGPAEEGNPFQTGEDFSGNAGFDIKLGLKSNLTLDATVNPDFGQVEVDPAVINLSAYETYYQEKRPFFIEGASIFRGFGRGGIYINASINWPNPTFFYSRRIGRIPQGSAEARGYVKSPDRTTILGAAKVTGKLGGSWNVGGIAALTGREYATVDQSGRRLREEVEPLSFYGVWRVQKDIEEGRRGIGVIATGVVRDLQTESLSGVLNRNAFGLALDGWTFLDAERNWVAGGWFGGTRVEGSPESILRLQKSSLHYFQRPDATHVRLDPEATSLSGWGGHLTLGRQNGKYLVLLSAGALSPGFDPNDVGFQYGSSDVINIVLLPGIQWTKPGKVFRYALVAAGSFRNYDFGGNKTWDGALVLFQGQLRNFWSFNTMFAYNPQTVSRSLTRGGPLALVPWGYQVNLGLSSDDRKAVVLGWDGTMYRRPDWGTEWNAGLSVRWKPRSNILFSLSPRVGSDANEVQWVTRVADPLMASTYGTRYVFGRIEQKILSSEIRLDWTFTPRLTLQAYLQPFIAVGDYERFKELAGPRSKDFNVYGENGSTIEQVGDSYFVDPDGAGPAEPFSINNPDFNFKSLRGTVVLRWEYRPGSLLYFVWTQNRADYAHPGELRLGRDLSDLLSAPGDNIFLLKVSYRWNM